jgi:DNA modification methylase
LAEDIIVFVKPGNRAEEPSEEKQDKSALTQERLLQIINPVWNVYVPRQKQGTHSAVMSEEVCARLIEAYSFWGDIVLDPFAGTGTTLQAAKKLGRYYVGYEIYPHYQSTIEKKLNE